MRRVAIALGLVALGLLLAYGYTAFVDEWNLDKVDAPKVVEDIIEKMKITTLKGADGVHCWDLNSNTECDTEIEDVNCDGKCDVLDCRGRDGEDGMVFTACCYPYCDKQPPKKVKKPKVKKPKKARRRVRPAAAPAVQIYSPVSVTVNGEVAPAPSTPLDVNGMFEGAKIENHGNLVIKPTTIRVGGK
jgi:hypothetical protein